MRFGRLSLARQLSVFQAVIIAAVLGAVVVITLAQSTSDFRRTTGNRILVLAETFATDPVVRGGLSGTIPVDAIPPAAARVQSVSGTDFVAVVEADGSVIASQDPDHFRGPWLFGESDVRENRAWIGSVDEPNGGFSLQAHVPVLDPANRETIGYVAVGSNYPSLQDRLTSAVPDLLIYLGVASSLGLAGSLLLSRRIKRQTFGLEPRDIAGLVEHREALLYGLKEGVLGIDLARRVTIANSEARTLLQLPEDVVGMRIDDLGLSSGVVDALIEPTASNDRVLDTDSRNIVLNRMPVSMRGKEIGSVVTLRDFTELSGLRRELDVTKHTADSLRAQTHEFSNRLHTIGGLLRLGHVDRARDYVLQLRTEHTEFVSGVTSRIDDPILAALVVAKGSVASERGVGFELTERTRVGVLPLDISAAVGTILGNLIDNALDACGDGRGGAVRLEIRESNGELVIVVSDNGLGVADELLGNLFERGVTSKTGDGTRGIGLALVRRTCEQRGGGVSVRNDGGAVFTVSLPLPQ
ncbi:ATP-binding protein [Rhodococcus sp. RS1C4]|nr:ATP-binding protein [Rhodococcus sp. RS1C4]